MTMTDAERTEFIALATLRKCETLREAIVRVTQNSESYEIRDGKVYEWTTSDDSSDD